MNYPKSMITSCKYVQITTGLILGSVINRNDLKRIRGLLTENALEAATDETLKVIARNNNANVIKRLYRPMTRFNIGQLF